MKLIAEFDDSFEEICNISISDFILGISKFNEWKDKAYKYAMNCNCKNLQTYINNYILFKEEIFNDFLMNIPEYYNYYC